MNDNLVATSSISIDAPPAEVWSALTDPVAITKFFFGATVESTWTVGTPISWAGEYNGTAYRDHGTILELTPPRVLVHTHFSPLGGREDIPENYHTLTYRLEPEGDGTRVTFSQDNNHSWDEVSHNQDNWDAVLAGLKKVVES